jgi:hypothetical protein
VTVRGVPLQPPPFDIAPRMGIMMEVIMNPAPLFSAPLGTPADIVRRREHVDVHKDLSYVFAAITRTRHGLRGEVPLVRFCGAPWTRFSYMIEAVGPRRSRRPKLGYSSIRRRLRRFSPASQTFALTSSLAKSTPELM